MAFDSSKRLIAPCVTACPAAIDVPRYIGYVERGQFPEAHAVVREAIPLPMACGLICYRPCEPWCRRGIMEQPIAINAIKRAAVEHGEQHFEVAPASPTGKRVAIVGGGPAGLTAAYYLATRRGHRVTLFDANSELGGQLRVGLPKYKVPRDRLRREVADATSTRVKVRASERVNSLEPLLESHDAVLLAIGHGRSVPLEVPGADLPGVRFAADFLRDVNLGKEPRAGKQVVIIGGNNVAIDAARCAVRLGAQTTVAFDGPKEQAKAYDFEIAAAVHEGVEFAPLLRAVVIARAGKRLRVRLERLEVAGADEVGRPIVRATGEIKALDTDIVLVSVGEKAAVPSSWPVSVKPNGFIKVEASTCRTSRDCVFACGDAVTGPDSIVEAMAQGKKAAQAIDRFLGGDGDIDERFAPEAGAEMAMPVHLAEQGKSVVAMPLLPVAARRKSFALVEQGYSKDEAIAEARRCIRCDLWRLQVPEVWPTSRREQS
ncbi:MAG: FAD-dependent oxidoreductase [Chloroflexi bacterium]|nr:FAD-dependent oxidoreductase [Chloroflexota bacterium]